MQPLLQLADIEKSYGGVSALRGVSFDLLPGEVHALVGENGAGKSTLIKIVTGAVRADSGTLQIGSVAIEDNDPLKAKALGVAVIYQQPALFPDLSVAENIALALEKPGAFRIVRWGERRRIAETLLKRIGAEIDPATEARHLSMPEQQLVEIAKAIGSNAKIVIMDEPTASLSDREVDNLFRVILELRSNGVGIIYVSHRLEELPRIADRVTALRDGSLVGTRHMADVDRGQLIQMMVGRELDAVYPKMHVEPGEIVLETHSLSCRAGGIRDVNLQVRAGEIVGLAGLVGAGRTELARVLFGITPADAGTILLKGQAVVIRSPQQAVASGIAYVPEDRRRHGVILEFPVAQNATLAILRKIASNGFLDLGRERELAGNFAKQLGVKAASLDSPAGELSGGNQQKVALARWLATEPAVMVFDEPTQGVDVGAKAEIHRLMGEMANRGMAILMISSELPEILGMSDRIAVMHGGRVMATLDRRDATQAKLMELALGHPAERAVPA